MKLKKNRRKTSLEVSDVLIADCCVIFNLHKTFFISLVQLSHA